MMPYKATYAPSPWLECCLKCSQILWELCPLTCVGDILPLHDRTIQSRVPLCHSLVLTSFTQFSTPDRTTPPLYSHNIIGGRVNIFQILECLTASQNTLLSKPQPKNSAVDLIRIWLYTNTNTNTSTHPPYRNATSPLDRKLLTM